MWDSTTWDSSEWAELLGLFSSIGTLAFTGLQLHPNRFDEPILIAASIGGGGRSRR